MRTARRTTRAEVPLRRHDLRGGAFIALRHRPATRRFGLQMLPPLILDFEWRRLSGAERLEAFHKAYDRKSRVTSNSTSPVFFSLTGDLAEELAPFLGLTIALLHPERAEIDHLLFEFKRSKTESSELGAKPKSNCPSLPLCIGSLKAACGVVSKIGMSFLLKPTKRGSQKRATLWLHVFFL